MQATIRRLSDKERFRNGFTLHCGLGSCRRTATCMARLVGIKGAVSEGAFCDPCAAAFCRVNKVGMPTGSETQKLAAAHFVENAETQKQLLMPASTVHEPWKPEWVR